MARERARAGASDERTPGPTAILPKGRRRNGRNTPPAGKLTAWTARGRSRRMARHVVL